MIMVSQDQIQGRNVRLMKEARGGRDYHDLAGP